MTAVNRRDLYVMVGKTEMLLPGKERIPTEEYGVGDLVRAIVHSVKPERDEARARLLVGDHHRVVDMERKGLAVNRDAQVVRHAWVAARRLLECLLDRHQHDFAVHAALALDEAHNRQQLVVVHGHNLQLLSCQKAKKHVR